MNSLTVREERVKDSGDGSHGSDTAVSQAGFL